jgi:hypothetical protein
MTTRHSGTDPGVLVTAVACALAIGAGVAGGDAPLAFANETATRLVTAPALGVSDNQQKSYAWGDLNQDGWIDLVVVRKQPFTSPGKQPNVLFMNENGVLTDRTAQFASAAINLPEGFSDSGFLTPTNDRDVAMADVNGDGWLDVITAVTISDGDPKHIGHPRIYINLGVDDKGDWRGLVFDNARIPAMLTSPIGTSGAPQTPTLGFNPRFNAVAAGDVTGDGLPELFFVDHDGSGAGGSSQPSGTDFNNKLLLNDGTGFFIDVTLAALTATVSVGSGTYPVWLTWFGNAAAIADMNQNGLNDLIFCHSLGPPQYLGVAYNDTKSPGSFPTAQVVLPSPQQPYNLSVADLNRDGRLDVIETDANVDHYLLNLGVDARTGHALWGPVMSFPPATNGFGGMNIAADLNDDGWLDVLIADVDVDIAGCARTADILINNANPPNVTFTVNSGGIPNNMLTGVYHFAVFDINNDGCLDLVIGRCASTQVWIHTCPPPPCPADLNGSGGVDGLDLGILLINWSIPPSAPGCGGVVPCLSDLNGDGFVNGLDLGILLGAWGACAK